MQKILVTGASGYLAHRLLPIAARYGEVTGVARSASAVHPQCKAESLDLTDSAAVVRFLGHNRPDVIIHAAAANPGSDPSQMDAVNHQASNTIATAAATSGCRLVVVSTESVHGGDAAPYSDDAIATPISTYGRTKALGEQAVLRVCPQAVVVRTSLIYGLEQVDRGTKGFVERLGRGEELVLFNDVLRQPVWVDSLSDVLCQLAINHAEVSGIMNVVGGQVLSRAEFAYAMLDHWKINTSNNIKLISGQGIDGLPMDLRCRCDRAVALGFSMPGVADVLAQQA